MLEGRSGGAGPGQNELRAAPVGITGLTWSVMEALNAGLVAATVQEEIGQGRGEQGLEMDCGAVRIGLHLG